MIYLIILLSFLLIVLIFCIDTKHTNDQLNPDIQDTFVTIDKTSIKKSKKTKKYKFCIMGIFKNEEDYLEEWIIFHIEQGISHFYLYSNDPDMSKYPYLSKYSEWITLIPWVNKKNEKSHTIQRQAYEDCVRNYHNEYQYIMMLDIDEFLISILKDHSVIDVIDLLDDENTKAIKVRRYDFGSDGNITKPKGNVMDNYMKHEKKCSSYKTIANSDYLEVEENFYGVHDFPFINKKGIVFNPYFNYASGIPSGCGKNTENEIPLIINHYYLKSYQEYLKRCEMWQNGGINTYGYRKNCENKYEEYNNYMNEIEGHNSVDVWNIKKSYQ